jgi:hypothetical protein
MGTQCRQPHGLSKPPDCQSKYFPGVTSTWISSTQTKIAYISAWKTVAYFTREILGLLPKDCHRLWPQHNPPPPPWWTNLFTRQAPLTAGGIPGHVVHSSLINIATPYLRSMLNAGLITLTTILNRGSDFWSCIIVLRVQCSTEGFPREHLCQKKIIEKVLQQLQQSVFWYFNSVQNKLKSLFCNWSCKVVCSGEVSHC